MTDVLSRNDEGFSQVKADALPNDFPHEAPTGLIAKNEPMTVDSELVQWGKYCETVADVSWDQFRAMKVDVVKAKMIADALAVHAAAKVPADMPRRGRRPAHLLNRDDLVDAYGTNQTESANDLPDATLRATRHPAPSAGYPGNVSYPADAGYPGGATVDAAGNLIRTKPGVGRPEHQEENKALKEDAFPTDYPSQKIITARAQDAQIKSAYEASRVEPHPVADPVIVDRDTALNARTDARDEEAARTYSGDPLSRPATSPPVADKRAVEAAQAESDAKARARAAETKKHNR